MAEGIAGGAGGGDPGIAPAPPQEQQQNLIESFRAITSAASAEALFFLESHAWQLDAAVQSFFDTADDDDSAPPLPPTAAAAAAPSPPASSRRRRRRLQEEEEDEGDADDDDEDYVLPPADDGPPPLPATRLTSSATAAMASSSGNGRPSRGPGGRPAGGIRTLADLNRRSGNGSGSNTDDDSDGPQEYYTGGEKSGMLVQDPSKGNPNIDDIFEQARQTGEVVHEPIEQLRASSSSKTFTGTGRLLSGETVQVDPQPPESVVHDVVFWTNGFTVNDGPLRRFNDPENAAFLESIKRSECPRELEPADRRTAVHVSLSRREEKCPEPVKRFNPFGGVGRTLGAGSSASSAAPEAAPASAALTGAPPSAAGLYVDDSLPSASIQLRLADGTRMVARFNNHHTVGDIRGFIDASRPGATRSYQLQTVGFPPKQLTDVTQTIEQAGLANSVVIQKL